MKKWLLIQCKPKEEDRAVVNLERQSFEVYQPKILQPRRRRNKWVDVIEPLFPRYLFVRVDDAAENCAPIRSTFGVSKFVRFGDHFAFADDKLIEQLRSRENDQGVHEPGRSIFQEGDKVRLVDSPLAGLQAVFEKPTGEDRVFILLNVLGKENRIKVKTDWIVPANV